VLFGRWTSVILALAADGILAMLPDTMFPRHWSAATHLSH